MNDSKRQSRRSDRRQKPGKQTPTDRPAAAANPVWRRGLLLLGIVAILGGGAYLYFSKTPTPMTAAHGGAAAKILRIAGSDAGYVEPSACADCHRQIWETYRRTGMGRSFARVDPKTAVEDYTRN